MHKEKKDVAQIAKAWAERSEVPVWFEPKTTSTNLIAKENILSKSNTENISMTSMSPDWIKGPSLYLCSHQTQGRGRFEREWLDHGTGQLLSSWAWEGQRVPSPLLSPLIGLALYRAASSTWFHSEWNLKAPNDLYLGAQKIAGLLIEIVTQGESTLTIIGLGMNLRSCPNLPLAGCLSEKIHADLVSEQSISQFLDRWRLEMAITLTSLAPSVTHEISRNDQESLQFALQKNPLFPKVLQLKKTGELIFETSETKHWMEL